MLNIVKFIAMGLLGINLLVSGLFILTESQQTQQFELHEDVGEMELLSASESTTQKETKQPSAPNKSEEQSTPKVAKENDVAKQDEKIASTAEKVKTAPEKKTPNESKTKALSSQPIVAENTKPTPPPKPEPTLPVAQCFKVGPIRDQAMADQLIKDFTELHFKAVIASHDQGEFLGYWVYLPPERSLALARLKLEELKTKGLSDVFLVKKEEPRLAISLGVYRNKLTAQKRQSEIRKLGYEPELVMRYKRQPETWLRLETESDKAPSKDDWKMLLKHYKGVKYEKSDC